MSRPAPSTIVPTPEALEEERNDEDEVGPPRRVISVDDPDHPDVDGDTPPRSPI